MRARGREEREVGRGGGGRRRRLGESGPGGEGGWQRRGREEGAWRDELLGSDGVVGFLPARTCGLRNVSYAVVSMLPAGVCVCVCVCVAHTGR